MGGGGGTRCGVQFRIFIAVAAQAEATRLLSAAELDGFSKFEFSRAGPDRFSALGGHRDSKKKWREANSKMKKIGKIEEKWREKERGEMEERQRGRVGREWALRKRTARVWRI